MQDDMLTLDKAVKQAKSSELVKEHHEILKGDGKATTREIYIVENLKEPLLGRPAIEALNLVQKAQELSKKLKQCTLICLKVWESWKENSASSWSLVQHLMQLQHQDV